MNVLLILDKNLWNAFDEKVFQLFQSFQKCSSPGCDFFEV